MHALFFHVSKLNPHLGSVKMETVRYLFNQSVSVGMPNPDQPDHCNSDVDLGHAAAIFGLGGSQAREDVDIS